MMPTRKRVRFHHSWFGAVLAEGIMAVVVSSLVLSMLPGFYVAYVKLWQRETGKLGAAQRADFAHRAHPSRAEPRRLRRNSRSALRL